MTVHDLVVALDGAEQDLVEAAGLVVLGGARELVVEAEGVEETAQHGVVVVAEALDSCRRTDWARDVSGICRLAARGAARSGTFSGILRMPSMSSEKQRRRVLHLALGQHLEGVAHHGGARDLAEGADVRQARRAVAGLEQHRPLAAALDLFEPGDQAARLLERPRLGIAGGSRQWRNRGRLSFSAGLGLVRANQRALQPRRHDVGRQLRSRACNGAPGVSVYRYAARNLATMASAISSAPRMTSLAP